MAPLSLSTAKSGLLSMCEFKTANTRTSGSEFGGPSRLTLPQL